MSKENKVDAEVIAMIEQMLIKMKADDKAIVAPSLVQASTNISAEIEDNGEAYFATKKILLNGKTYFKDDMLDGDIAQSDIAFLLNRGLIVLHT